MRHVEIDATHLLLALEIIQTCFRVCRKKVALSLAWRRREHGGSIE